MFRDGCVEILPHFVDGQDASTRRLDEKSEKAHDRDAALRSDSAKQTIICDEPVGIVFDRPNQSRVVAGAQRLRDWRRGMKVDHLRLLKEIV